MNAQGKVVRENRFDTDEDGFRKLVSATRKTNLVMEASSSAIHIYDVLSETCKVKVAHPLKVKAIASARIKTDKIDARILAQLTRDETWSQEMYSRLGSNHLPFKE